ncbi:unnamed protein product [Oppiella nova]|uniref:Uncharacterized protein n=1 Tax=Oppiella nova TaxID=334625 RepID=A0A7R9MAG0_9ACAR|nr:unnamed protein product [Oppiella nova]CAG2173263.1 unnamed protein product [Oppiella nova]
MDISQSSSFKCKKWTLFGVSIFSVVATLLVTAIYGNLGIGMIITLGLIGSALNSIGAFGAYKEHYGLTMAFAILALLGTLGSLGTTIRNGSNAPAFILNLVITVLAFSFANDLNKIKLQQLPTTVMPGQYPAVVTIVGPPGAVTPAPPPEYSEKEKKNIP